MEQINSQVFVYGSLRSGFQHPAYQYISRYFMLVSDARVKGVLYDMGEYPAAIPADEEKYIHGELYRIKNQDEFSWAMAQLDDYEGLNTENNEPALYRREEATVYTGYQTTRAWIYWYNREIKDKPVVASGDVLQYLAEKNKS